MLAPQYRDNFNASLMPIGRLGRAEEVADLALFLVSERATFINGSISTHTLFSIIQLSNLIVPALIVNCDGGMHAM